MQIFQKSSGDGGKRALEKRLTYCPLFAEEKGTGKKTWPIVPFFAEEKLRQKKRPPIVPFFAEEKLRQKKRQK